MKVVVIDIDDTIEYLLKAWVEWLNNKYGTNVDWHNITDWDVSIFFPELSKEQVFEPVHSEDFWQMVEPMPDAIEYTKKLHNDGYELYLCSSTDYRNVKPKYKYIIQKHFPFIDWEHVIIAHNKTMIKADIFIDDGVHNLQRSDCICILMTAPHNKAYDAEAHGMIRVANWKEIYEIIENTHYKAPRLIDANKLIKIAKDWYWNQQVQQVKDNPCVVDIMIDLFIRTIKEL